VATKGRVFSVEFRVGVVQRMMNGEPISRLSHELDIKRSVLYRWQEAFQKEGVKGFRVTGRPKSSRRRTRTDGEDAARRRMAELERKIGQQALDLDFLRRAFKRVKETRRQNIDAGGKASTERSGA
jgi:transposase